MGIPSQGSIRAVPEKNTHTTPGKNAISHGKGNVFPLLTREGFQKRVLLTFQHRFYDKLVFKNNRSPFGGPLQVGACSSAPLDKCIPRAYVYGDRRPYLVALLMPNLERPIDFARGEHIRHIDIAEPARHNKITCRFAERIAEKDKRVSSHKTIKHFAVLPHEFTIEGGEMAPALGS